MRLAIGLGLSDIILTRLAAAVESGSTLLDDLVSYWTLDETSGTRADSVGDNDLTDNNTVGAILKGPSGTAARFVSANDESLSKSAFVWPDSYSVSAWFYPTAAADGGVIGQIEAWPNTVSLALYMAGSTTIRALVGDGTGFVTADDANATLNTWHHAIVTYDALDKKVRLYLDNGAAVVSSALAGTRDATAGTLAIGDKFANLDGRVGEVAIWSRVLTAGERTSLFNSGVGKAYADLTTAEKVGLVSYWNLDEVSGTRVDAHGDNDLTDNNTVGSVHSGPSGTVASFVAANSESLSITGRSDFNDWSTSIWFYAPATPADFRTLFNWGSGGYPDGYMAYLGANGANSVLYVSGSGTTPSLNAITPGWHHLIFTYDKAAPLLSVYLDGGSAATIALPNKTVNTFTIGYAGGVGYYDDEIGEVAIWSRVLTAGERTSLFNSGVGKHYADLTAAEKVGLVEYWDLTETSGNRTGAHAATVLTDNNTVGSVINAGGAMDGAAANFVAANSEKLTKSSMATFLGGDFALSFWAKLKASNEARTNGVVDMISGDVQLRINFATQEDTNLSVSVALGDGAGTADTGGGYQCAEDTNWHHWVLQRDGTTATLYRDNSDNWMCVGSESFTSDNFAAIAGDFVLGFTSQYANMYIDEVAIWSRVLTEDERTALYNAGAGRYYDFTGSPV